VSDVVFKTNGNCLHHAALINVGSERIEIPYIFSCAWKGSVSVEEGWWMKCAKSLGVEQLKCFENMP